MSSSNPYRELVDALVRELTSDDLEELPEDLFSRVNEWIQSLRRSVIGGEARSVVEALARECQELMTALEEVRRLKSGAGARESPLSRGAPREGEGPAAGGGAAPRAGPPRPELPRGKVLVTFKTPLRDFVASDLRVYGPFREGDVCLLPVEDAAALEARGVVEVLVGDEGTEQD